MPESTSRSQQNFEGDSEIHLKGLLAFMPVSGAFLLLLHREAASIENHYRYHSIFPQEIDALHAVTDIPVEEACSKAAVRIGMKTCQL